MGRLERARTDEELWIEAVANVLPAQICSIFRPLCSLASSSALPLPLPSPQQCVPMAPSRVPAN